MFTPTQRESRAAPEAEAEGSEATMSLGCLDSEDGVVPGCFAWAPGILKLSPLLVLCYVAAIGGAGEAAEDAAEEGTAAESAGVDGTTATGTASGGNGGTPSAAGSVPAPSPSPTCALVMRMDRRQPLEWIPLQGLRLALHPLPELMPDEQAISKVGACEFVRAAQVLNVCFCLLKLA